MNIAIKEGETAENVERNLAILADALGFRLDDLICTRQTHSDIVRVVTKGDHISIFHRDYPECDGIVTNEPGVALVIFTADCTPILLHDPITGAVGAVHAGWRGTAMDIAGKAVAAMTNCFGCKPENICAAIGPNISACCFETGEEVPQAIRETFGEAVEKWIRPAGEKYYVNLKEVNRYALARAGVRKVEISDCCTSCENQRFFSHRVTKGERGSQGAIIVCKGEKR
jgi:YfiH family protein